MKIRLNLTNSNQAHTNVTVLINGANVGTLTLRTDEVASFHQIMAMGCRSNIDEFISTGAMFTMEEGL